MSLNSSMQVGVSAMKATSTALTGISNNIANMNTTGYKATSTSFSDLISGNATGTINGQGVVSKIIQNVTSMGDLSTTTSQYNLAVNGQGMFVVSDSSNALSTNSTVLYTRDGSFSTDTNGYLLNTSGYYLEGWVADSAGNINQTSSTNGLQAINVKNIANTPTATTTVTINGNLDSDTVVSSAVTNGTYNPTSATQSMAAYSATTGVGTQPDTTMTMTISDGLGGQHTVTLSLLKKGLNATTGETEWNYEVSSPDVIDANGTTQISYGTLSFTSSGVLDTTNSTTAGGTFSDALTINGSTSGTTPHWSTSTALPTQAFNLGVTAGNSTITSTAADTAYTAKADGTEFGTLTSVTVGKDGVVTAIYDNGDTKAIAKVALATFNNANGLIAVSGNTYKQSTQSGSYTLSQPGSNGVGTLESSTLENSTVDLSEEFTHLITTQRAYSAASKIITTADQMMQELLTIKQ